MQPPFPRIAVALAGTPDDANLAPIANMLGGEVATVQVDTAHPESNLLLRVAERRTDLLVIGIRPHGESKRVLARAMAMRAPCSILAVPSGWPPRVAPILVAVDFGRHSVDALKHGILIARRIGIGEVSVVHAYLDDTALGYEGSANIFRRTQEVEMLRFLRRVDTGGVTPSPVLVEAPDAVAAILEVSESLDAGLVVMGTRGRTRPAAIVLRSEAEHALRETTRPLLLLKRHGAAIGLGMAILDAKIWRRGTPRFG